MENNLSQDLTTLSAYLQTWRLKLSNTKTVMAAFHLNNRKAKRELNVYNNGNLLPFCPVPMYLGLKLDRSLTFHHHLEALRKKLSTRAALLRRLAGSGWGAGAKTSRISDLFLVYSTAEYCALVWCRSILASLTVFLIMLCAFSLDACVPHQRRTCLTSQASSQLSSTD